MTFKKQKLYCTILIISSVFLWASCKSFTGANKLSESETTTLSDDALNHLAMNDTLKKTIYSINNFGVDLFKNANISNANISLSPFSIYTAFSILYAGANDMTRQEMINALGITQDDTSFHKSNRELQVYLNVIKKRDSLDICIANALWVENGFQFLNGYTSLIKENYLAKLTNLDFMNNNERAVSGINNWVKDKTNGKIQTIFEELPLSTKAVITNAIYFKGNWQDAFSVHETREAEFHLTSKDSIRTPIMYRRSKGLRYFENDNIQLVDIPYKGDHLSMTIILPKETVTLDSLYKLISAQSIAGWIDSMVRSEVLLYIPKFKIESSLSLNKMLPHMGMSLPFSDNADFSRMTNGKSLKVGEALHKTYLKVDERGTEAAAVTGIVMVLKCIPAQLENPKIFRADHPFIFIIRDTRLGCFLFLGQLLNPKRD